METKSEVQALVETGKKEAPASVEFAMNLFDRRRMFGLREIKQCFKQGVDLPDGQVITFSRSCLVRADKLGHILIYAPKGLTMEKICRLCGNKTFSNEQLVSIPDSDPKSSNYQDFFFNEEMPEGWWLVSKVLPGSYDQNYLDQTSILADYLKKVSAACPSSHAKLALDQFTIEKEGLLMSGMTNPKGTTERLLSLEINKYFRPSPVLLFWVVVLYERISRGERLLERVGSWTNSLFQIQASKAPEHTVNYSGCIKKWPAGIGDFGPQGLLMTGIDPFFGRRRLGVCYAEKGDLSA